MSETRIVSSTKPGCFFRIGTTFSVMVSESSHFNKLPNLCRRPMTFHTCKTSLKLNLPRSNHSAKLPSASIPAPAQTGSIGGGTEANVEGTEGKMGEPAQATAVNDEQKSLGENSS